MRNSTLGSRGDRDRERGGVVNPGYCTLFGTAFWRKKFPNSVGESRVGRLAFDLSFVEPNFVCANVAVVNSWLPWRLGAYATGGGEVALLNDGNGAPPEGDVDWLPPHEDDDTGEISEGDKPPECGDRLRVPNEAESLSIGSKDSASGLNA